MATMIDNAGDSCDNADDGCDNAGGVDCRTIIR
jgi:hypothetical protein